MCMKFGADFFFVDKFIAFSGSLQGIPYFNCFPFQFRVCISSSLLLILTSHNLMIASIYLGQLRLSEFKEET